MLFIWYLLAVKYYWVPISLIVVKVWAVLCPPVKDFILFCETLPWLVLYGWIFTLFLCCQVTRLCELQQLQPWIDTFVQLRKQCKIFFFHKLFRNFWAFFCFVDPAPPLDPGSHFDMLCELARKIIWQKGMLCHGGRGGHTQKLTTRP